MQASAHFDNAHQQNIDFFFLSLVYFNKCCRSAYIDPKENNIKTRTHMLTRGPLELPYNESVLWMTEEALSKLWHIFAP